MAINKKSNTARQQMNKLVAAAYKKHCAKTGGMIIDREKTSANQISAELQKRADVEDKVTAARGVLHGAILERAQVEDDTQAVFDAVRQSALIMFASAPDILAEFGLAPKKERRGLTAEEKLAAVNKAKETRAARHTVGSRQRLQIRAEVVAPHGAPTQAATPAPVATPAPAGGGQ